MARTCFVRIECKAMTELIEQRILCPYCNEPIIILVDPSVDHQDYIEDCQVCCRPIDITADIDSGGELNVWVKQENE